MTFDHGKFDEPNMTGRAGFGLTLADKIVMIQIEVEGTRKLGAECGAGGFGCTELR